MSKPKAPTRSPDIIFSCHRFWFDELIEGIYDFDGGLMYLIDLNINGNKISRIDCDHGVYSKELLQEILENHIIENILLKEEV